MDAAMTIRDAAPSDYPAIRAVISHAFGQTEVANLVEKLRAAGDALVDLVAASETAIQGHIFYSPLAIEGADYTVNAAALAPVSVLKSFQKTGIGSALIRAGNARCGELGLDAIVVLGHEAYYPKFGFSAKL